MSTTISAQQIRKKSLLWIQSMLVSEITQITSHQ